MRKNMFQKAKYLNCEVLAEGENFIRFRTFGEESEHEVELKYRDYNLLMLCNCTHGAMKPGTICSHIICCLAFLVNG